MLTMDWDYEEAMEVAREESEKIGKKRKETEMVINLYYEKDPLSKIARVTGKSVEEIKQILQEHKILPEAEI